MFCLNRLSLREMLCIFMVVAMLLTVFVCVKNEIAFYRDFYQQQVNYTDKILNDASGQIEKNGQI